MISLRTMTLSFVCIAICCSFAAAQDLSKYRDFEFGTSLESVAKLAAINPSGAKTVHQSPELIQNLDWDVHRYFDTSPNVDSVRNIRFDFYNAELFQIVVSYDVAQTIGLNDGRSGRIAVCRVRTGR